MVFCGTAAMTIHEVTGGDVTHVGIAITWGLIVMAVIYAFAFAKKFAWKEVSMYILAQVLGAILAVVSWRLVKEENCCNEKY